MRVVEIVDEGSGLLIEGLPNGGRSCYVAFHGCWGEAAFSSAARFTALSCSSVPGLLGLLMQEIDHLLMGLKRAERFALLVFSDAFCKLAVDAAPLCRCILVAVNDRFRLEYDLAAFCGRLKHIANADADLVADALGNDNLEFVLDGYDGHAFKPVVARLNSWTDQPLQEE